MISRLTPFVVAILLALRIDRWRARGGALSARPRVARYRRAGIALNFVARGGHDFEIMGDLSRFSIGSTSHLKSGSYIEASGGVRIGSGYAVAALILFLALLRYSAVEDIPT